MSSVANINVVGGGATQAQAPVTHAAAPTTNASTASQASSFSSSSLTNPADGVSPRLIVDPIAGVIIQYLSSDGKVLSQLPSAAAVAYLRAGLTAQGDGKPNPLEQQDHKTSTTSAVA